MKTLTLNENFVLHLDARQHAEFCWMPWAQIEHRRTGDTGTVALRAHQPTEGAADHAALGAALLRLRAGTWRD
jgi:hypothetical protein